jgi:hypothetical protein
LCPLTVCDNCVDLCKIGDCPDFRVNENGTVPFRPKIAEAAMECLADSPYRTLRRVSCECKDGILFLSGRLSSFHEKQLAQETVAQVKGMIQVVNEIEVD